MVHPINLFDALLKEIGDCLRVHFRGSELVLGFTDDTVDSLWMSIALPQLELLENILNERKLICGVVNGEGAGIAEPFNVLAQNPCTSRMESRCPQELIVRTN